MNKKVLIQFLILFYAVALLFLNRVFEINLNTTYIFAMEYLFFGILAITLFWSYKPKTCENLNLNFKFQFIHILDICVLSSVIASCYILNTSLYTKPLLYYILLSIAFSLVCLKILLIQSLPYPQEILILFEIIIIAIIIITSSSLINPFLVGADTYWHFNTIASIISTGFLDHSTGNYYYYPLSHIYNAILSQILLLPNTLIYILLCASNIIAVLFIYLIGKTIISVREALISSLLLSISVFHNFGSISNSPQTFGLIFVLSAIYTLLKCKDNANYWYLFWICAIAALFIHPIPAVILILYLGTNIIYEKILKKEQDKYPAPFLSYLMIFISYIVYINMILFRKLVKITFLPDTSEASLYISQLSNTTMNSISHVYYLETFVAYLGPSIFLMFGILGSLLLVQKKRKETYIILLFLMILNSILVISMLGNLSGFEPTRILPFNDSFWTIPAGAGIIYFSKLLKPQNRRYYFIFFICLVVSFFSLTSYLLNDGNTLFTKEVVVHPAYLTESTIVTHHFLVEIPINNTLYIDQTSSRYLSNKERGIYSLNNQNVTLFQENEFGRVGYYFINKQYIPYGTYASQGNSFKIKIKEFENSYYNLYYSNGLVHIYKV